MAKEELFAHPLGAKLFTALGGIPVKRGSASARAATKAIETALRDGEPAAIFPEGTRSHGPTVAHCSTARSYLAVKLGCPIVPVAIAGSEEILASGKKLPRLHRVSMRVGTPISPPADARRASGPTSWH